MRRQKCFNQSPPNKLVSRAETFLQTFPVNNGKQFSLKTFCGTLRESWRRGSVVANISSSHEQEIILTAFVDGNCVEVHFQTDQIFFFDFRQNCSFLKMNLVEVHGCEFQITNENEKQPIEETKNAPDQKGTEEDIPGLVFFSKLRRTTRKTETLQH